MSGAETNIRGSIPTNLQNYTKKVGTSIPMLSVGGGI